MNTESVFPHRDQRQVLEALTRWRRVCMKAERGAITPEALDDLMCLAASVGRGERLSDHLLADLSAEDRAEHELTVAIEAARLTLRLQAPMNKLSRHVIDDQEPVDTLEESLAQEDVEGLEVLSRLLVLDDHLCALSALNREAERRAIIERVGDQVGARLIVNATISAQARRFIERHGPRGAWGEVWREVAEAREALDEAEADFEAVLDARLAEINAKQREGTLEISPVLAAAFAQAGVSAFTDEEELSSGGLSPAEWSGDHSTQGGLARRVMGSLRDAAARVQVFGEPALILAADSGPQRLSDDDLDQTPLKSEKINGEFSGELFYELYLFNRPSSEQPQAKRVVLFLMHEGVEVEGEPLDLSDPESVLFLDESGEPCSLPHIGARPDELRVDLTRHREVTVVVSDLDVQIPINIEWSLQESSI